MAYIGKTPTPAALTASDITDGIITSAKIADATIATADIADSAVTKAKTTGVVSDPFRNVIINGDMSLSQRSTSESSITSSGYHTIDRFNLALSSLGTWTMSQSTTVPTGQGFAKSLKLDCTSADSSPSSGDAMILQTRIEGQMLQYLKKGTSSAESTTISFWVRSYKTGTYIVELRDKDNSRQISKSYTISSADTWEKKEITFAGDTTGAFDNDNASSLEIEFWLGAGTDYTSGTLATSWASNTNANKAVGQVNLADNTSNDYYITGVQLEAGTSASDFEFLPFDVNLERCQRYFYQAGTNINGAGEQTIAIGQWYSSSEVVYNMYAPTTMRTKPTLITPTVTNGYRFHKASSYADVNTAGSINDAGNQILAVYKSGLSGGTGGQATFVNTKASPAKVQFSAEL